eukprot:TRINITY_DN4705_c0_g3_i2.p1 TRINITY_DN4705_c0_g3~~TRINITY_DN4705_c0_g3_i2.p1  ORF type:complete len:406 (+),score=114.05 TRINITY_DN4705_c0_g3_i2:157-1374(+)
MMTSSLPIHVVLVCCLLLAVGKTTVAESPATPCDSPAVETLTRITVVINGADWGGEIIDVPTSYPSAAENFAVFLNLIPKRLPFKEDDVNKVEFVQIFNSVGRKLLTFDDVATYAKELEYADRDGEARVWAVPYGDFFIYPGLKAGLVRDLPSDIVRGPDGDILQIETLALDPKVFIIKNFFSDAEGEHMEELFQEKMKAKTESHNSQHRNSYSVWLNHGQTDIVEGLEWRTHHVTHMPRDLGEPFNCNHYEVGEHFNSHHDIAEMHPGNRNRLATMILYLREPEEGGATCFPRADNATDASTYHADFISCKTGGVCIQPIYKSASLFYNMLPEQHMTAPFRDEDSLHIGCDVEKGEKWICNRWMMNDYDPYHNADRVLVAEGVVGNYKTVNGPFPRSMNKMGLY